jgi:hypothetical protein
MESSKNSGNSKSSASSSTRTEKSSPQGNQEQLSPGTNLQNDLKISNTLDQDNLFELPQSIDDLNQDLLNNLYFDNDNENDNIDKLIKIVIDFANKFKYLTNNNFDENELKIILTNILNINQKFQEKTKSINDYIDIGTIENYQKELQTCFKEIASNHLNKLIQRINEQILIDKKKANIKKKE